MGSLSGALFFLTKIRINDNLKLSSLTLKEVTMSNVQQPVPVELHLEESRAFVRQTLQHLPLHAVFLDDWNTGGVTGARLIYDAPCVNSCQNHCQKCPIFQTIGEDNSLQSTDFRTTLCLATPEQTALFTGKQRYLNCKTIFQYQECFALWMLERCPTEELLLAELEWVNGFRLIYYAGSMEPNLLINKEIDIKRRIISLTLAGMEKRGEMSRQKLVADFAKKYLT